MPLQLSAASVLSALANFLLSFVVLLAIPGESSAGPSGGPGVDPSPGRASDRDESRLRYLLSALAVFFRRRAAHPRILLLAWYIPHAVLFPVAC